MNPDQAIELAHKLPPGGHPEVAKWVGMPLMLTQPSKAAALMVGWRSTGSRHHQHGLRTTGLDNDASGRGQPRLRPRMAGAAPTSTKAAETRGDPGMPASIGNENLRAESLIVVYQTWRKEDPAARRPARRPRPARPAPPPARLRKCFTSANDEPPKGFPGVFPIGPQSVHS